MTATKNKRKPLLMQSFEVDGPQSRQDFCWVGKSALTLATLKLLGEAQKMPKNDVFSSTEKFCQSQRDGMAKG